MKLCHSAIQLYVQSCNTVDIGGREYSYYFTIVPIALLSNDFDISSF
jgi:hypothetical protein